MTTLSLHSFMRSSQAESIIAAVSWLAPRRRRSSDKLQRVLNSAARIVSNTRKFDRGLTHFRRSQLHWLDVVAGFGSESASRCSDICTRWLLNTCWPTANPSPAFLVVATCDRLTQISTCETCFVRRTFMCISSLSTRLARAARLGFFLQKRAI